jgi:hypothetical protein
MSDEARCYDESQCEPCTVHFLSKRCSQQTSSAKAAASHMAANRGRECETQKLQDWGQTFRLCGRYNLLTESNATCSPWHAYGTSIIHNRPDCAQALIVNLLRSSLSTTLLVLFSSHSFKLDIPRSRASLCNLLSSFSCSAVLSARPSLFFLSMT